VLLPFALVACPHPINNPADPEDPIADGAEEVKPGQPAPQEEPDVEPLVDPEGDVQPRPHADPNEGPGAEHLGPLDRDEGAGSYAPDVPRSPPAVETDNPPLSV
jgi:hypothetical protein